MMNEEAIIDELIAARRAIERMQALLTEYAAKQVAQHMFLIGLATHTGQKFGSLDVITRGVEQATRDLRRRFRDHPGASGQLVVDEMARIADALRARENAT